MRIVFLQDDFPPQSFGGAGISTFELARAMKRAGHDVFVITTCRDSKEAGESFYEGLTIFKIASSYRGAWRAYVSINNRPVVVQVDAILRKLRPDVVHANNIHAHLSYASFKVAKKYAKAVVWTARDTMSVCYGKLDTKRYLERLDARTTWLDHVAQARKRWNPLRNFFIRRYLRYTDARFAVSDALRDALEVHGIPGVNTMHTGMDVNEWNLAPGVITDFKKRHGLEHKKVLLFGGRLSAEKGGGTALKTLAALKDEVPEAALLVVGVVDDFARAMEIEAQQLGMGERVIYTDWISGLEHKAAFASSDLVLVPSIYLDPLPRTMLEGMAAGKPVVGSRYGGASEAVLDGQTGYIVDSRNVEEMAHRTAELLKDPQKAARMGEAGRERIRTSFSLEGMVDEYLRHYEAILRTSR